MKNFVINWTVENFKFIDKRENANTDSAVFLANNLKNTRWYLKLVSNVEASNSMGIYLARCKDLYTDSISVGFEMKVVSPQITMTKAIVEDHKFKVNTDWGFKNRFVIPEVIPSTVTIECRIWLTDEESEKNVGIAISEELEISQRNALKSFEVKNLMSEEVEKLNNIVIPNVIRCLAITRINVKKFEFHVVLKGFTDLKENEKHFAVMKSSSSKTNYAALILYMNTQGFLQLDVARNTILSIVKSLYCKVSVLDIDNKTDSSQYKKLYSDDENSEFMSFKEVVKKSDVLSRKDVLLRKDTLSLNIEIVISKGFSSELIKEQSKLMIVKKSEHVLKKCKLSQQMKSVWTSHKYTDAILQVNEVKIPVHKAIVCNCSPVLEAMFSCDMQEKATGIAKLTDMDLRTLNQMLLYMYSQELEDMDTEEYILLYEACDRYQFLELMQKCSNILKISLSIQKVCAVFLLADDHNDQDLKQSAIGFICANAKDVLSRDEWKDIVISKTTLASEVFLLLSKCIV